MVAVVTTVLGTKEVTVFVTTPVVYTVVVVVPALAGVTVL